ncbi:MAG: response regulator [Verrucomicrobiota bacterium]
MKSESSFSPASRLPIVSSPPPCPIACESGPINILLVDDEPRNLIALETVLDDPGYRLVRAESADEALLALVAQEFALLILDIQMPGMNGFELAAMIKGRHKTASVPIIFLTAYYSEEQHVKEGYGTGAVDFLQKPINAHALRSKVAVFADLHRKTRDNIIANQNLLVEIAQRRQAQEELRILNEELERRVEERTAQLRESESRFRALAEEMPHCVWETDPHGTTTYRNLKWLSFSGHPHGASDSWLELVHPDEAVHLRTVWESTLQAGEDSEWYCRHRRASDGEYRWFHVKAAAVRNAQGNIVRWVGTSTDIHEQKIAQEALRAADRRKNEFLAMLGHELRNPLAAIRHAVRISQESIDGESKEWAEEVIDRQSAQLARMVDDLLDVERINRGRIELRSTNISLDLVLLAAIRSIQPAVEQKNHVLIHEVQSSLQVHGDAARLEQVFVNLLNNAVKYTPEGGEIRILARREGDEAVIQIEDNGVGIPPDLLPHVFDLFTQAGTSLDRAQGGLGIGLTVVRTLVEMHGGKVQVESHQGVPGTRLTVNFPIIVEAPAEETPAFLPLAAHTPGLPKPRVLIVDDHVDTAQTLKRLLTRRNCEVYLAHDGPAGLLAARELQPDVLLLDLGLPGFDGFQLARSLQSDAECSGSLFVAISGYAQESDLLCSREAGFHHHFAKPVNLGELTEVITQHCQQPIRP